MTFLVHSPLPTDHYCLTPFATYGTNSRPLGSVTVGASPLDPRWRNASMTEAAAPIPAGASGSLPLSRREFLYYLWGASMAVAIAGATGATIWFALPRFKEGEFGGVLAIPAGEGPPPGRSPAPYSPRR